MVDRGFDLNSCLPAYFTIDIPVFMNGKEQLDILDETEIRRIAFVGIHSERAIARIKSFCILKTILPISIAPELNKTCVICCYFKLV